MFIDPIPKEGGSIDTLHPTLWCNDHYLHVFFFLSLSVFWSLLFFTLFSSPYPLTIPPPGLMFVGKWRPVGVPVLTECNRGVSTHPEPAATRCSFWIAQGYVHVHVRMLLDYQFHTSIRGFERGFSVVTDYSWLKKDVCKIPLKHFSATGIITVPFSLCILYTSTWKYHGVNLCALPEPSKNVVPPKLCAYVYIPVGFASSILYPGKTPVSIIIIGCILPSYQDH